MISDHFQRERLRMTLAFARLWVKFRPEWFIRCPGWILFVTGGCAQLIAVLLSHDGAGIRSGVQSMKDQRFDDALGVGHSPSAVFLERFEQFGVVAVGAPDRFGLLRRFHVRVALGHADTSQMPHWYASHHSPLKLCDGLSAYERRATNKVFDDVVPP